MAYDLERLKTDPVFLAHQKSVCGIMTPGTMHLAGEDWARAQLPVVRSYQERVLDRIDAIAGKYKIASHGTIDSAGTAYDLVHVIVGDLHNGKPNIMFTGGTHGYEEGGVEGVLEFLENHVQDYEDKFNFVIIPCMSPWAFEHDRRLTARKENPNRNFFKGSGVQESELFMKFVHDLGVRYRLFVDCHETTWTDAVILPQEGNLDIDPADLNETSYVIETARGFSPLGARLVAALERAGFPCATGDKLFGLPNDGGVLRNLEDVVPTLSQSFMLAATDTHHAPTDHAMTLEPFVTEGLFHDPKGVHKRAHAQIVQLRSALAGILTNEKSGIDAAFTPGVLRKAA